MSSVSIPTLVASIIFGYLPWLSFFCLFFFFGVIGKIQDSAFSRMCFVMFYFCSKFFLLGCTCVPECRRTLFPPRFSIRAVADAIVNFLMLIFFVWMIYYCLMELLHSLKGRIQLMSPLRWDVIPKIRALCTHTENHIVSNNFWNNQPITNSALWWSHESKFKKSWLELNSTSNELESNHNTLFLLSFYVNYVKVCRICNGL